KGKGTDVPKIVEKGKAAFAGPELRGKQLGIVGLGAIGVLVANAAIALGMDVVGYDPAISVEHAWGLSSTARRASSLDGLLASSDYVTLHLPLNEKTRGLFGADALAKMKATAVLLNYARAELVDSDALLTAVAARKLRGYVTDFPTDEMLGVEHVLPIPHLGASTPESEDNCADMAAAQLRDYLETGAIRNSVNLPDVALAAPAGKPRVTVIHQNIPNMLAAISSAAGKLGINISDMTNRSRGNIAYTVLDLDDGHAAVSGLCATLAAIEGVIRVRVI
ncbi:MAG: 3-phosphoglycerate dehydrogenase, partial [Clostridia bacterium]|nr:3-phosphoglycerate dehydrogenase [Clostridia bacterium]